MNKFSSRRNHLLKISIMKKWNRFVLHKNQLFIKNQNSIKHRGKYIKLKTIGVMKQ